MCYKKFFSCIVCAEVLYYYNNNSIEEGNMQKVLEEAVRVILAENDAEWKAEFEEYGYDTDMWVYYGDGDCEWRDNVETVDVLEGEAFGFMCGNERDRRCYGFEVTVYKAEEADGNYSFWITAEDEERIG